MSIKVRLRCGHFLEKNKIFDCTKCNICNKRIFKKNQLVLIKSERYGGSDKNPKKGYVYNIKSECYLEIKFENNEVLTILKTHCI